MSDYGQATTMEAKYAEIAAASKVQELDAMWAVWEKRGLSKDGLLYSALLQRKAELGHTLSTKEEGVIAAAEARRKRGRSLPPIKGGKSK